VHRTVEWYCRLKLTVVAVTHWTTTSSVSSAMLVIYRSSPAEQPPTCDALTSSRLPIVWKYHIMSGQVSDQNSILVPKRTKLPHFAAALVPASTLLIYHITKSGVYGFVVVTSLVSSSIPSLLCGRVGCVDIKMWANCCIS